jgi:cytochrome c peroxidase
MYMIPHPFHADPHQAPTASARAEPGTWATRRAPLRALWQHPPYFHDGSAATLEAVVEHYNGCEM